MKKTTIGGQALIEGIMMKGPDKTVLAVRYTDGTIRSEPVLENGWAKKHKILRLPVIRGVVGFISSMITGYKSLMRSADLSGMTELEEQQEAEKKAKRAAKKAGAPANAPAVETEQGAAAGTEPAAKAELGTNPEQGAGTAQGANSEPAAALKGCPEQAQSVGQTAGTEPAASPQQASLKQVSPQQASLKQAGLEQAGPQQVSLEPKSPAQAQLEQSGPEQTGLAQASFEQANPAQLAGCAPEPAAGANTKATAGGTAAKAAAAPKQKVSNAAITGVMVVGCVLGVALALFLFMWLPARVFDLIKTLSGGAVSGWLKPLVEGLLKIAIFILYLVLVSKTKDIKRVFQYHGAEHKTIFCYESGAELTVENCRRQTRFHPRCGTSFMVLMLFVGIALGYVVLALFPAVANYRLLWVLLKILIVPLVCGLGYELIKLCGRYDNFLTKMIAAPGLWVQRITTKEPDDSMLEVAICALKQVIPDDPEKDRW